MSDTSSTRKRTRTRTSHSKGGCITCKVRHLKCDQGKPKCMRCSKAGWECDGYAQPKPPAKPSKQIRALAPKMIGSQPGSPIPAPISSRPFKNEREFQCFEVFRTKLATQLSSFFESKLWNYIVLQTAEENSPVSHAAIAFGAWSSPDKLENNREYAFAEYGKALSFLREALSHSYEKETPSRQVIITLLLCVNFEVLAGFAESATQLTVIGINFLQSIFFGNSNLKPLDHTSPRPNEVEDELVEAFAPLDIYAMAYNDSRSKSLHEMYRHCGQHTVETMPEAFTTLKEAYLYLGLLVRRALHHLATMEPYSTEATDDEQESISSFIQTEVSSNNVKIGIKGKDQLVKQPSAPIDELRRWDAAFQPLLARSLSAGQKRNHIAAHSVRLDYLIAFCMISGANAEEPPEEMLEEMLSRARTLIELLKVPHLSTYADDHPSENYMMIWNVPTAVTLSYLALHARKRSQRRAAISLLLDFPRRERMWDTRVLGKAYMWLFELLGEALDHDGEFVSVETELKDVKIESIKGKVGEGEKGTRVSCLQPLMYGGMIKRETVFWLAE